MELEYKNVVTSKNCGAVFSCPGTIIRNIIAELQQSGYRRNWQLSHSFTECKPGHTCIEVLLDDHQLLLFLKLKYSEYFMRGF